MDKESPVLRSLDIIEKRISEKLTVENIAGSVYFSKYYYGRMFREIMGETVMEYVTKRKLTLAGRALLETTASISDVAFNYGFESHEGFTRSFKAYMGVTPTEYRKYGLSAISQKTVKGKYTMYSKATVEIIRELNDFIAYAKDTAQTVRKYKGQANKLFWNNVADKTDDYADELKTILDRIGSIAEHPDEITNRFTIIKTIEDCSFKFNLLAFGVSLVVMRKQNDGSDAQKPLCTKYYELAGAAAFKVNKIAQFFNELSALIFEDMRNTAAEKIKEAVEKGKAAVEHVAGYPNIKKEVESLVNEFSSTPLEDITASQFDDYMFRLYILHFAGDLDASSTDGADKAAFGGLIKFKESLSEAAHFFKTLVKPESCGKNECKKQVFLQNVAFQTNILLFYTRGEMSEDKLGQYMDDRQKAVFKSICEKLNNLIHLTNNAAGETSIDEVAGILYNIKTDMLFEEIELNKHGVSIRLIALEIGSLADRIAKELSKK